MKGLWKNGEAVQTAEGNKKGLRGSCEVNFITQLSRRLISHKDYSVIDTKIWSSILTILNIHMYVP